MQRTEVNRVVTRSFTHKEIIRLKIWKQVLRTVGAARSVIGWEKLVLMTTLAYQLRSALRSLVARTTNAKKVGNFQFLCLVQVTRIYIAAEKIFWGFVLASKRVPRCKEEAVLKNVWTVFALNCTTWLCHLFKHVHTRHCKHLRNFMLYSFYRKTVRHIRKFKSRETALIW